MTVQFGQTYVFKGMSDNLPAHYQGKSEVGAVGKADVYRHGEDVVAVTNASTEHPAQKDDLSSLMRLAELFGECADGVKSILLKKAVQREIGVGTQTIEI